MKYQVVKDLSENILYKGEERNFEKCVDGNVKEISVIFIEPQIQAQRLSLEEYLYERNRQGLFQKTGSVLGVDFPLNDEFFEFLKSIREKWRKN